MHDTKSFVLEVTEDTWRCLRELRAENEALRAVVAELRAPGPTLQAGAPLSDDPVVLRRELAETRQELARQRALLSACEHDARRAVESQESLTRRLEAENEVFAHRFLELEQKAEALASLVSPASASTRPWTRARSWPSSRTSSSTSWARRSWRSSRWTASTRP